MTKGEAIWGFAYLVFQQFFLPSILLVMLNLLPVQLDLTGLNLVFYCVNFLAVALIFRRFFLANLDLATEAPALVGKTVLFGMARYFFLSMLVGSIIVAIDPEFINFNDETIAAMAEMDPALIALCTIVLVPPVEEGLYRGLIFRNLYQKNKVLAHLISTVAFAAIHLVGYLTEYTPMELFLAFLQYVPAGLCLAWAYERSGTIFTPVIMHALVNAMGIAAMR